MSDDVDSLDNTAVEPVFKPKEQDHSYGNDSLPFKEYSSLMLLIIGVAMLGLYLMYLLNSTSWGVQSRITFEARVERIVFSEGFIYAIIGVAVLLMALHLRNRASSNKILMAVAVFCGLNAAILFAGIIVVVTTEWSRGRRLEGLYAGGNLPIGSIVLGVLEILAFIALILVEMPAARTKLASKFKREGIEDVEEEGAEAD